MKWSYRLGQVAGTEVKIHVTFFLLLIWLAWEAYAVGGTPAAIDRTVFTIALFACVVFHEFGHIFMAKRFGVRTPDVILLPIGGVARLERIPDEPEQEFAIAIAGPLVTLAIAVVLYLWLLLTGVAPRLGQPELDTGGFAVRLMWLNLFLLGFNLIPAFPMDGGRVLRSLLATRMGLPRATRVAGAVGQLLAVGMGIVGFFGGGPILLLIAVFVFLGAGAEASAVETRMAGAGLNVSQVMVTQFRTIPIHATLADAVDMLLAGEQREFPVVDNLGRTEGILTRDNLIRGLRERGPHAIVGDVMTAPAPAVSPGLGFGEALERLKASGLPALPVVDAAGALVGLLTMDNISELLLVRRAAATR
ncbi:MAG TPA: site-2 protease family protein [Gemmatimonadales bacterium]|nr:site-2 protease family protein [Gemmatimonadales bacterium]